MTFGKCEVPKPVGGGVPTPQSVARDSSYANPVGRPLQPMWLFMVVLVVSIL